MSGVTLKLPVFKSGNWKVEISDEIENCSKDEISKDEICRWNENCSADEISKDEICRWNENCSKDEIFQRWNLQMKFLLFRQMKRWNFKRWNSNTIMYILCDVWWLAGLREAWKSL